MAQTTSSALRALALEYKGLQEEPVEGFRVKLVNEDNMFEWEVAIFGPPDTLYQGGYFKAHMKFPTDYPYSPPSIRFMTKVWHPNVYESGDLCISILHPPVDDPQSGELPCERTILLSVISLLNEPNTFSPANVDASVMYRRWRDSKGKDNEYENIIRSYRFKTLCKLENGGNRWRFGEKTRRRSGKEMLVHPRKWFVDYRKQAQAAKMEAEKEGIVVPVTLEDYCIKTHARPAEQQLDMTDFYDDEYELDDDDDDDDDAVQMCASEYEDDDDSGNGES
ncbi:Ubiquitin-conjugating enzyme E2 R1 [Eufriesea mexicana]|nr:Ubiquitin-conjugating enzyme E2 R1 [Eufriesea mexicana]